MRQPCQGSRENRVRDMRTEVSIIRAANFMSWLIASIEDRNGNRDDQYDIPVSTASETAYAGEASTDAPPDESYTTVAKRPTTPLR